MDPTSVGQPPVNEGHCVVETPTSGGCQPLSKPAHVAFARKSNVRQLEPGTAIDEDLVRTVDQDVAHPRLVQQRLQRASADTVASQRFHGVEYG
jgi:hypothetical protein